jgi:hypothetical protein
LSLIRTNGLCATGVVVVVVFPSVLVVEVVVDELGARGARCFFSELNDVFEHVLEFWRDCKFCEFLICTSPLPDWDKLFNADSSSCCISSNRA